MHILALCWFAVTGEGPCDILGNASNPCVAAHSTVRALYGTYEGPLYKVTRGSDGASADIGVLRPGGFANITAHDTFCPKLDCVISNVFDQTPNGNHLGKYKTTFHENLLEDTDGLPSVSADFCSSHGVIAFEGQRHKLVNASQHKIVVGDGVRVYGMWFDPGE